MRTGVQFRVGFVLAALIGTVMLWSACERKHTNPLDPESDAWKSRGEAPTTPEGVTATGEVGRIRVGWDSSEDPDVAGYAVYRADRPDGDYVMLAGLTTTITTGKNEFYDTGVVPGTTHYYRVAAVSRTGVVGEQSAYVFGEAQ